MNIILLQAKLKLEEIDLLLKEFPQYLFLSLTEEACRNLNPDHWERVEVFYGSKLNKEELSRAPKLRWIHLPNDDSNQICMEAVEKQGNLLVSITESKKSEQVGEFVMGGILAFAKQLFQWKEAVTFPGLIWDSKWRNNMWTLEGKVLLQIGLDSTGSEIAKRAKRSGMKVYGIQKKHSFHPHCDKILSTKELHSVLPAADVVVLALPKSRNYFSWFTEAELALMKEDTVLIVVGNNKAIDEKALVKYVEQQKLRGVLIDMYAKTPINQHSPLFKLPNVIITPQVADVPIIHEEQSFQAFRFNLRQYLHGNFNDMHNLISHARTLSTHL